MKSISLIMTKILFKWTKKHAAKVRNSDVVRHKEHGIWRRIPTKIRWNMLQNEVFCDGFLGLSHIQSIHISLLAMFSSIEYMNLHSMLFPTIWRIDACLIRNTYSRNYFEFIKNHVRILKSYSMKIIENCKRFRTANWLFQELINNKK